MRCLDEYEEGVREDINIYYIHLQNCQGVDKILKPINIGISSAKTFLRKMLSCAIMSGTKILSKKLFHLYFLIL